MPDIPQRKLLSVCPTIRCNGPRHDPCEASRYVLVLLRGLDACQDLLDTNANLLAVSALLNLSDCTVDIVECVRAPAGS